MKNFLFFTRIFRVMVLCSIMLTIPSAFASVEAQNKAKAAQFMAQSIMGFEENKGQIFDQNNQPNNAVKFMFRSVGLNVQLRSNGFSYDSYRDEVLSPNKEESSLFMMRHDSKEKAKELSENKQMTRHFHRVDIELVGASSNPEIVTGESYPTTHNYYTHNQVIENVRSYETVMYKNIYPNIDLEFFISAEGNVEYQFYIRPGGDAKHIRLRYNGALKTYLADGKIIMDVAHGSIAEHIPLSYLANSKKEMTVQYVQNSHNEFTCSVPSYLSTETLIIDPMPQLSWSTFYGGGINRDSGSGITTDVSGNVYVTGYTSSNADIATTGSYQTTFGGIRDVFIVKFNSDGVRQWGTYYGGTGSDEGNGIAVDASGNVYVTGWTESTTGIATAGAYQTIKGVGNDAFIVKFSSDGVRQWGTYYGGADQTESGLGITTDATGSIYVIGNTTSTTGISTVGAHQTIRKGSLDVFIVKFNSDGVRQWGTYYGGTGYDQGNDITIDIVGNICIVGETESTTDIATAGAYQTIKGERNDAFIVKFSSDGVRQWGTYYGGLGSDSGSGITTDVSGNIYVTGSTTSNSGISTVGAHQTILDGFGDAFVVKFTANGIREWGTYYGGDINENGRDIVSDANGDVYIIGETVSTTGIATVQAYQTFRKNGSDVFVTKFTTNGVREWGTYYGGDINDMGNGIASNANGDVYIIGFGGIATVGAHQTTTGGGDAFIAKFSQSILINALSDIIATPGFMYSDNIPYHLYQSSPLTLSNSVAVMGFTIRDGGASGDDDEYPTILTSLTLSISNAQYVRKVALFDGETKIAELDAASTLTFSGLSLSVADNTSKNITVRASFSAKVDDNEQCGIVITSVASLNANSGFAQSNGGGAASSTAGDYNRIEVTADRLRFVQQPSDVNVGIAMQPDVTVEAIDELNNRDLDVEGREVFITNRMLNDSPVEALLNGAGIARYGTLTFGAASPFEQLMASSPGYEPALSASFAIRDPNAIDNRIVHFNAGTNAGPDNSPIDFWADVAGNDDNAEQTVMARRPALRNSAAFLINSHPVVQFGVGRGMQIMTSPELSGGTSKTILAVIRTGANVTHRQMIMELGDITGGFNMYIDGFRLYAGAWDQLRAWHLNRQVLPNRVYLVQFVYDGSRNRLSLNSPGAIIEAGAVAVNFRIPSIQGGNQLSGLGAVVQQTRYHNGYSFVEFGDPFLGQIAEAVVLNSANYTQRTAIFDELNRKYNIGASGNPLLKESEEDILAENAEHISSVSIYPNPVQSSSSIIYQIPVSGHYSLLLQDVLGNTVMEIVKATQTAGTYSTELQADALLSGMYRLVLTTATGSISTPVVIQK